MKEHKDIVEFLEQPIPRDEVATRSGGGAKKLSYLETWKVIDLLNEAFGNLGWDSETIEMIQVTGTDFPTYRAKVRIKAIVQVQPGQYLTVTKEGYGWGADKSKLNAHEMAVKEAESDAIKRAAMKFGKRVGLALYDKTQEHVTDEQGDAGKETGRAQPVQASQGAPVAQAERSVAREVAGPKAAAPREVVSKTIRATAKVLADKKVATMEQIKEILATYNGAKNVDDLSDEHAHEVLNKLQGMLK